MAGNAWADLRIGATIAAFATLAVMNAAKGETRGYVVSWFHLATYSEDGDCPEGLNPPADVMFRQILARLGKTPAEIDTLFDNFPNGKAIRPVVINRGRIDGKAVNVYQNPTSEPDPEVKTVKGRFAYGFNLDGKVAPGDFTDPETGEAGVDNQLFRALGCFRSERAMPPARPTYPAIQWDMTRDQMPAWVIEITGIERGPDGRVRDGDVEIGIHRATGPITRNAAGDPQADMTYAVTPNPRWRNAVHGHIRGGRLMTDIFDFTMSDDPFAVPEYTVKQARMRLAFNPDGTVKGILGGYQPWKPIYVSFGVPGATNEFNLSIDVPGIYYALRKLADADPDPATGQNTAISAAFTIEAVPAFVVDEANAKTAAEARSGAAIAENMDQNPHAPLGIPPVVKSR